jgi:hypothetical protein
VFALKGIISSSPGQAAGLSNGVKAKVEVNLKNQINKKKP